MEAEELKMLLAMQQANEPVNERYGRNVPWLVEHYTIDGVLGFVVVNGEVYPLYDAVETESGRPLVVGDAMRQDLRTLSYREVCNKYGIPLHGFK